MANGTGAATAVTENPLCGKLQSKFSARGIAAVEQQIRRQNSAGSTTQQFTKAGAYASPFENTAEYTYTKTATASKTRAENRAQTSESVADIAARRRAAYAKTTPFESGAYAQAYARAAKIRARAADGSEAKASAEQIAKQKKTRKKGFSLDRMMAVLTGHREDEVRVKSAPVSKGLIIALLIITAVVMMMVYSFAQIYEFKNEISTLESQKSALSDTLQELTVRLDAKNDIRVIEQTATNDIGMVRSNLVESRYVSVTAGERVEVIDDASDGENKNWGVFATMLSSFGSSWDNILDYIE